MIWNRIRPTLVNLLVGLLLVFLGSALVEDLSPPAQPVRANSGTLTLGWQSYYPYQFEQGPVETRRQSGLDTELVRETCRRAGYQVNFVSRDWTSSLLEVEKGSLQGVSLAFRTAERDRYAYFSVPFFSMRSALFFRRNRFKQLPEDCRQLPQLIADQNLNLGITRSFAYAPEIQAVLADPRVQPHLHTRTLESEHLDDLMNGSVDLVIADELSGTSQILKNGWNDQLGCLPLDVEAMGCCLMFSKKSVRPEVVEQFNAAYASMERDGTRAAIVRAYYYPPMLNLLAHSFGFDEISVLATAACAISGIFLARKEGYNLVGAFVLAAAPAAGGGLIRDLIAGRRPVAVVGDPSILITVVCLVLAGFLIFRLVEWSSSRLSRQLDELDVDQNSVLIFFDSLGLAAFTVLGVLVAMQWHCEPLWLWGPILAATTNVGGACLRDVIRGRPVGLVSTTTPYAEISIAWGFLLSAYLIHTSSRLPYHVTPLQNAVVLTLCGVCLTHYLVRRFGFRSPQYGKFLSNSGRPQACDGN